MPEKIAGVNLPLPGDERSAVLDEMAGPLLLGHHARQLQLESGPLGDPACLLKDVFDVGDPIGVDGEEFG